MGGMAVYGLGIVLTLTDNVSGRLGGVNSSLQNLSQTAMSLTYMGKSLMNIGKGLLTPVVALGKEIVRVNADAEKTRITLGALYEDTAKGNEKFMEVMQYAAKTPFRATELKEAAVTFKTLGVEILGTGADVTSTSGKTKEFMEILGDLGAGLSGVARRGFADVTYAVKEFVTEGNKLSFLRRLGIDIDTVLGNAGLTAGNTIEERLKNMADIAEILHFEGLTSKMFGTWTQVLSNMGDVWDLFLLKIGDTETGLFKEDEFGNTVFGGFKRTLDHLQKAMDVLKIVQFGEAIGKAMYSIMQPLDMIGAKLVDIAKFVADAIINHPIIAKIAILLPTIAGALFLVAGAALVAKGAMMTFGYGLGVIVGMIPGLLEIGLIFGAIGYAWSKDMGGIRTRLNSFMSAVYQAFSEADRIAREGTDYMIESFYKLKDEYSRTGDFGTGLTVRLLELKALWTGFVDYWNDSELSDANYQMLERMGLLPVFSKIAVWTDRFKAFAKGVCQGFADMIKAAEDFGSKVMGWFGKLPFFSDNKDNSLMDIFSGGKDKVINAEKFTDMGKTIGKLLPLVLGLMKIRKILSRANRGNANGGLSGLLGRIFGGGRGADDAVTGAGGMGLFARLRNIGSQLASMKPTTILKGLGNLAIILGGLSLVALAVGGIASISPTAMVLGGLAIAGLSAAIQPIGSPLFDTAIDALKRLARFKPTTFLKGVGNLAVILGSMTLLSMALGAIISISPSAFIAGGVAIAAMGALFTAMGNPLFMSAMTSLQAIAKIPPVEILKGIGNLAIIFGAMALLFMVIGAISLIPFDYGRIFQLALVIGVLGAIGSGLAALGNIIGNIPVQTVALGLANMAIMLVGLSAVMLIMNLLTGSVDLGRMALVGLVITELGIVGFALGVLGGILGIIPVEFVALGLANMAIMLVGISVVMLLLDAIMGGIDIGLIYQLLPVITLLGVVGTALTVFAGIAGLIPIPLVLLGLTNIGLVLEGLTKLAILFSKFESQAPKIESGCQVLATLGKGLGKAIGSFIGGIGEGISSALPAIGENIASFFDKLTPVMNLSGVDNANALGDFLKSLGQGLLTLTANDILSVFTGGTDFGALAEGLSELSQMSDFFKFCDANAGSIPNAKAMFECLADISNLPMSGGLAQVFTGVTDFAGTASGLNALAETQTFWDFVGGIGEQSFTNAKKFFEALADISNIPNAGGIAQFFSGTNDFSGTATGLASLVDAKPFFEMVADLDVNCFDNMKKLFKALAGIGEAFPNTGGVAQWFAGENDISGVGAKLKQFGADTKEFFNMVSNLKVTNLSSLWDSVKKAGGVAGTDLSGLANVGTQLKSFLTSAGSFFKDINSIDTSGLTNVATELSNFFNTINSVVIPSLNGLSSGITSLVSGFESIGTQITGISTACDGVATSATNAATAVSTGFITMATSATTASVTVTAAVTTLGTSVSTGFTNMATSATTNITTITQQFTVLGTSVTEAAGIVGNGMSQMQTAVETGAAAIVESISSMCESCQGILSAFAESGSEYGASLVSNIAAGITGNAGAIRSAIESAVSSAASSVSVKIPIDVGQNATGTMNWAGGLTTINERGGELVDLPRGTRIYPHDKSVTMAFDEGIQTAMEHLSNGNNDNRHYDDSVHFHAGSIVVQPNGVSEAEAERFAELIMLKIENKQRRKMLANYAY